MRVYYKDFALDSFASIFATYVKLHSFLRLRKECFNDWNLIK